MIIERLVKIMLVFFLSLFCLSVAMDNIIDYQVNIAFLKHIMTMDTMRPGFDTMIASKRSISSETVHALAFHSIIAVEFIAGFIALYASIRMFLHRKEARGFNAAKRIYLIAAGLMMSLWYFGFNVIAANWFYMWVNINGGQQASYNFSIYVLLTMIYVMQRESTEA